MMTRNKIFIRFIISYIFVLFITIFIGIIAYQQVLATYKEITIRNGLLSLEKGRELVEARFDEMNNMVTQLILDEEVRALFHSNEPIQNKDYYKFLKIQKRLTTYKLSNHFIDEIFIFFDKPFVLISSAYTSDRTPMFYEYFMKYQGMNVEEWRKKVMDAYYFMNIWPSEPISKEGKVDNYITYIHSYPVGSFTTYRGAVMMHIKESQILQHFSNLEMMQDAYLAVLDHQDQIISSLNVDDSAEFIQYLQGEKDAEEIQWKGQQVVVMRSFSQSNNWTYIAAIPVSYFEKKAATIRNSFALTVTLILLTGLLSAAVLAYRNSNPIRKLIEKLNHTVGGEGMKQTQDFNFLEGTVSRLIHNNENLKVQLEQQLPLIQASFMERLLKGGFNTPQELQLALSHANMQVRGDRFMVVVMKMKGYDGELTDEHLKELDIAKAIAANAFQEQSQGTVFIHNIDIDTLAVVCMQPPIDKMGMTHYVEDLIVRTNKQLTDQYNLRSIYGIGTETSHVIETSRSFNEALKALDYKRSQQGERIIWFKDIPQHNGGYEYPIELEIRLMNLVKSGDVEAIKHEIRSIQTQNLDRRQLSNEDMKQLYYEIRGTIIKIREELFHDGKEEKGQINTLLQQMDGHQTTEEWFERVNDLYRYLCMVVLDRKKQKNQEMTLRIIAYIQLNFADINLGLYSVASEFDLTEKYLSQFFKDQTGENFATFVEKIRLERAIELMKQSELTIHEIATKVGYDKDNTFYRAFKRVYGVSPTTYRSQI
jgi:AraC-like DNA-binding protein